MARGLFFRSYWAKLLYFHIDLVKQAFSRPPDSNPQITGWRVIFKYWVEIGLCVVLFQGFIFTGQLTFFYALLDILPDY